jgi:phosphoribosyl 1,2-cyclic phosphodiesterase
MNSKLTVVGSSSHGNGYILDCKNEVLLIEAGVPTKKAIPHIDWSLNPDIALIVSHSHSDHAGYIGQYLSHGIPVYSTSECARRHDGVGKLTERHKYGFGGFKVVPLFVPHNAQCYSYIIDLPENGGRMLFITDTSDFAYHVPNVSFLLIEVNYCEDKLIERIEGDGIKSRPHHHLSLDDAIEVVRTHMSPSLQMVMALHLSDDNSDENEIKERFRRELGINIIIAEPGVSVELKKDDF